MTCTSSVVTDGPTRWVATVTYSDGFRYVRRDENPAKLARWVEKVEGDLFADYLFGSK